MSPVAVGWSLLGLLSTVMVYAVWAMGGWMGIGCIVAAVLIAALLVWAIALVTYGRWVSWRDLLG